MRFTQIIVFAIAATGSGLSGSDRICIEFARRWSTKHDLSLYVWKEGFDMCMRQNLTQGVRYHVTRLPLWSVFGFLACYLARILVGIKVSLLLRLTPSEARSTVVYSASEFWMDSIPAAIVKMRYRHVQWVAAWYQTAPNPFTGFGNGRYRLSAFLYWAVQFPVKPLISLLADCILVNNDNEALQFPHHRKRHAVEVVYGAVDTQKITQWKTRHPRTKPTTDAVFQGRFHPQKGVVELVHIWRRVVDKKPDAKLVMIGNGPLLPEVKEAIHTLHVEKNIACPGYLFDGHEKYSLFHKSKLVVHPALYDSGGMAAAEAMAFGLPCVGFDLRSYDSYYKKGMRKVPVGDLDAFAGAIIRLLENKAEANQLGSEAESYVLQEFSWDTRAENVWKFIQHHEA